MDSGNYVNADVNTLLLANVHEQGLYNLIAHTLYYFLHSGHVSNVPHSANNNGERTPGSIHLSTPLHIMPDALAYYYRGGMPSWQ